MPLAPGPFVQQQESAVPFIAGVYDFAGEVDVDLSGLDTIGAAIDAELVGMALFAGADETLIIPEDVDGLVNGVLNTAGSTFLPQLASIDGQSALADFQLLQAINFAPAAAWSDPPGPYVPPTPDLGAAPMISRSDFTAAAGSPIGGAAIGTQSATVQVSNTTRIGQPNFWVGDDFLVTINGAPGADVTLTATFNGESLGTADFGQIPASGIMTLTGTEGPEELGTWHEDWAVDGQLVASFNFLVLSS
jgi:hypothetical protein